MALFQRVFLIRGPTIGSGVGEMRACKHVCALLGSAHLCYFFLECKGELCAAETKRTISLWNHRQPSYQERDGHIKRKVSKNVKIWGFFIIEKIKR